MTKKYIASGKIDGYDGKWYIVENHGIKMWKLSTLDSPYMFDTQEEAEECVDTLSEVVKIEAKVVEVEG